MAIKTYTKGKPITYKFQKVGNFASLIAGNISAFSFVGENPKSTSFQDQLVSITNMSSNVEVLSSHALDGCYQLSNINFSRAMKEISDSALNACSNLSSLEFPESLEVLGLQAIANCKRLETVTFSYLDSDADKLTS